MGIYTGRQIAEALQKEDPDMNLRTVRYYTQIGLLPPLELAGNKRVYTDTHMDYFRAIIMLSKSGETLANIQVKLAGLTHEEVAKLGENLRFFQPEQVLYNETLVITDDVMISISPRVSQTLRTKMIETVTELLKEEGTR